MKTQTKLAMRIRSDVQRFESLKREIVQLNYFCKGTALKRMMKCGNKQCACHHEPAKRHGPYFECTYKIQNKTVNLRLYPEVTPLYRAAIQQTVLKSEFLDPFFICIFRNIVEREPRRVPENEIYISTTDVCRPEGIL